MFFTHDQMAKAIKYLHPELDHGRDYIVLMGIERDGTPASDAWIESWSTMLPRPSVQDLKDAYAASLLVPPPAPPPAASCTPLAFLERFTDAEQLAVTTAAMQAPALRLWYDKLMAAQEVVFADPRVSSGLDALVSAGLITQARSLEILPLAQRTTGMQQL